MKRNRELKIVREEFDSVAELAQEDQELLRRAQECCSAAYAPYSGFHVGAALRMEDGTIETGSNQENSAYPSGLCAERVAIFHASAKYPDKQFRTIAIAARRKDEVAFLPVTPCGSCRQVLAEYEHKQEQSIRLIMQYPEDKVTILQSVSDLLPFVFTKDSL
ncbi:MAG: cytidine deaminase [Cytophagales bacterium]|nr:cytidine deaminase [Cytophagales bacterium]